MKKIEIDSAEELGIWYDDTELISTRRYKVGYDSFRSEVSICAKNCPDWLSI